MKIICCGNRARGDDQAGLVAAERLRELGLKAEIHTGDALALLDKWSAEEDVTLIDAVLTGAPAGTVHLWNSSLPEAGFPGIAGPASVSSHGFDISKAIEIGRALGKLPARLRIYGIECRQFDHGANVSPEVSEGIETLVKRISVGLTKARS